MANVETLAAETRYYAEAAAPGTPSAGQGVMYVKTDGKPYFKNDGGNESVLNRHAITFAMNEALPPFSTSPIVIGRMAVPQAYSLIIESIDLSVFVATTNSGSHYWTIEAFRVNSANTATSLGSVNTSADAANTWLEKTIAVASALDASALTIRLTATKTGSPGTLHAPGVMICTMA